MAKNNKNSKRGLGRGLDSLIPKIEDNEEKNNSSITLEDILSSSEDEETKTAENKEKTKEETVEENLEKTVEKKEKDDQQNTEDEKEADEIEEIEKELEKSEENIQEMTEELVSEKLAENEIGKSENKELKNDSDDLVEKSAKIDHGNENDLKEIKESDETEDSDEIIENTPLSDYELASIEEVKEIIEKNPRITLWSAKSSAVFRYLRKTRPEFSISKEASELIDEAVSKRYPEIWELFKDL